MYADARHKSPWEPLLDQKLSLFALLMPPPVGGSHRLPIDLIELAQVAPVFKVASPGIRQSERPTQLLALRP